jgi:hypothetical protein
VDGAGAGCVLVAGEDVVLDLLVDAQLTRHEAIRASLAGLGESWLEGIEAAVLRHPFI